MTEQPKAEQLVSEKLSVVNMDMLYDAVKELTKTIADMAKEQKKLAEEIKTKVKAGRF
jgi:hypothetical protein